LKSEKILNRDDLKKKFPGSYYSRNTLYQIYNLGAKKRGYNFELNMEEFFDLIQESCFYCGTDHGNYQKKGSSEGFYYNGPN
jgi:hypothetical protein